MPTLQKMLNLDSDQLNIKRLIGSGNHLCEMLFRQYSEDGDLLGRDAPLEERFSKMFMEMVFTYNSTEAGLKNPIIRENIPYSIKSKLHYLNALEAKSSVDFKSCLGRRCPFRECCSYIIGISEAKDADIIIGNHALMFTWPNSFPRPEYIVVDEAHKIENEATSAHTIEISQEELGQLSKNMESYFGIGPLFYLIANSPTYEANATDIINQIKEDVSFHNKTLTEHLWDLKPTIEQYFLKMPKYTDIYWNEHPMIDKTKAQDSLSISIINRLENICFSLESILKILDPYYETFCTDEQMKDADDNFLIASSRFKTFYTRLDEIVTGITTTLEEKNEYAHSLKFHHDYGFALTASPINSGKIVHDSLIATSKSVVFTSATLGDFSTMQGTKGIEWATGYLYTLPERRFKTGYNVPEQFDYANNAKLFICDDTPSIHDRSFVPEVLKHICITIEKLEGKSLLLFSSKQRFEIARELLLAKFDGHLPVFVQGLHNNCVEEFKKSGGGILLGMESFGEGIDVPGDKLQFIFIDKIPDMRMDLVIQKRREFFDANIGNEFAEYYLSHRARSLKQKCGRLLRTESDHGAIIVADSRLRGWKSSTTTQFINMLRPYIVETSALADGCDRAFDFIINR